MPICFLEDVRISVTLKEAKVIQKDEDKDFRIATVLLDFLPIGRSIRVTVIEKKNGFRYEGEIPYYAEISPITKWGGKARNQAFDEGTFVVLLSGITAYSIKFKKTA